jgi:hypothetical protein
MKIIDQTLLQNEQGEISLIDRIKGTLQYGFSWYPELQAQKALIARLDKSLGKGYTLIRNLALGKSGIIAPMVLVGPAGIFVMHATNLRGVYQAKGDTWGTVDGGRFTPARINLIARTVRLARAVQVFLERQDLRGFGTVEAVILAADPGLHIDSVRPAARVVMSDAVERFAGSLMQSRPMLSAEAAFELVERLLNPRSPKQAKQTAPAPAQEEEAELPDYLREESAPQAALQQEAAPFQSEDLGFAFEDEPAQTGTPGAGQLASFEPTQTFGSKPAAKRSGGLDRKQLTLLVVMGVIELCIIVAFAIVLYVNLNL